MPAFALPLIPPAFTALGKAIVFVGSAALAAVTINEGAKAIQNGMEEAEEKAQKIEEEESTTDASSCCPPPDDDDGESNKESEKQKAKKAREAARKRGAELVDKYKKSNVGSGARSGQHGTPHKRAGNELIREANKFGKKSPLRDAFKTEGKRLIKKGNSINHR